MVNKYLALQKDVFDKSKITVVGSPTITSDGVASGFSSGNYIKANISSLDLTDNFKLSFQIITSSDVTTEQSVWGTTCNNQAFVYQIYNGVFRLYYPTGTGQRGIIDFGEVEANKTYNITLSCKNGTLTIQDYNKSFSFLGSTITFLYMGSGRFENTTMFKGSIDLPSFKVTTNNTTFSPTKLAYLLERRKPKVWNKGQFTIVGSPSISEDGIASGFSGSDYITTPKIVNITNTSVLKLAGRFKTSTLASRQVLINVSNAMGSDLSTSKITLRFETDGTSSGFITNADGIQVASLSSSNIKIQANTEYDFSFKLEGLSYEFKVGDSILSGTLSNYLSEGLYTVNFGKQMYIYHSFWLGSIDLKQFKIYTKERYDSKFTIVGSPTITADGVASGFSASNYIRVPYRPLGQNFKIFTPKFNSSDVSQQQKIVRYSDGNIRIEIYQNKIRLYRYSGNNVYDLPVGKTTLQNNTDYYYYVEQTTDGTNYYLKGYISTDDENWTLDIDKTYTVAMYDYQNNASIQISGADANQPFIGTLGLKQFKIYTNNRLVFDGEPKDNLVFDGGAETYVYDPSKFTIVGSPTITEYGVASGFSSTSYLQVQKFSLGGTSWSIKANIIPVANPNDSRWQTIFCDQIVEKQLSFFVNSSGTRLGVWIRSADDTGTLYSNSYFGNIINDKLQEVELRYENKTLSSYADGDKKASYSIDLDDRIFNNNKIVGFAYGGQIFYGSIDLPSTSITADGKEIFTGAKEQFYMLNGV